MSLKSTSKTNPITNLLGDFGFFIRRNITGLGYAARMFFLVLMRSGGLFKRPRLVSDQILFVGNYSFVIITVSGLFVGFVLGLQGYYTLTRYGSEQALGLLVALSLTRELGPVITALLFAGRAGTSLTAEIGLKQFFHFRLAEAFDGLHEVLQVKCIATDHFTAPVLLSSMYYAKYA